MTELQNILLQKNIDINIIKEAFEQTIFETYSTVRVKYNLSGSDTIYSIDKNIRNKYISFDIKYHIRSVLITQHIYQILHESIKKGDIDIFTDPFSFKNKQKYLHSNIVSNFQITDTLFTDDELEYINTINPIF